MDAKYPACGEKSSEIGRLGRLIHFTCRWCGLWFHHVGWKDLDSTE